MKENFDKIEEQGPIRRERFIQRIVQMNYLLCGVLIALCGLFIYQMIVMAKQNTSVENSTLVRLQLEGPGVVEQVHDLALRKENAQQTVVFTELNTKNGAPISVSVSTDTIDKEKSYVVTETR